ncbi:MAG: Rne/Rng family ribonuclease [Clostridiales bacterium]|nr:Rne/Rng family ribonuclease [Clostridiales bacterium]
MERLLISDVIQGQSRVAVMEDDVLVEYYVERSGTEHPAGNIYKGKVVNVLPGLDAAFVDIGLSKNAFLYVGDVALNDVDFKFRDKGEGLPDIRDVLKVGQELVVQVIKDPLGSKGARVTTHITLPGRMLVLMPTMDYIGVSHRIEDDDERERLKKIAEQLRPEGMGIIIRTVAQDYSGETFEDEINMQISLWESISKTVNSKTAPAIIHRDSDLLLRTIRDLCSEKTHKFIINNEEEVNRLQDVKSLLAPNWKGSLIYHEGDIFNDFELESKIDKTFDRRVWLKNGSYLIVDHTEALTVIDVNTGKFVGSNDFRKTIMKTNLDAAKQIARQVRLRDIGGIIIVDFIDMVDDADKDKVVEVLREALVSDRTRTNVVGMTGLGLVEMTRKKIRQRVATLLHMPCPICNGSGRVFTPETVSIKILRQLSRDKDHLDAKSFVLKVHGDVAKFLMNEKILPQNVEIEQTDSIYMEKYELTPIF